MKAMFDGTQIVRIERCQSSLLVLLDALPLELNGIAISHQRPLVTVVKVFSQRQVVETSKSLASRTFHSGTGRLEPWPRELQPWPGKKVIRFTASGI
jgi:hypothetical protein